MSTDAVRWRAPGRVNLIGEHTDYNDGFALPLAIAEGCTATVRSAPAGRLIVETTESGSPVELDAADLDPGVDLGDDDAWARYPLGVAWDLVRRGRLDLGAGGLHIALDSDVPTGVGLSSSAAVVCSTATAVDALLELGLDDATLLAVSRAAENDFVGAPTGGMDQLASLRSVAGHALLCDMRSLATEPVPFDPAEDGLRLLVIDSRAEHRHSDGAYRDRRQACEAAAAALGVPALRDASLDDLDRLDDPVLRRRARHIVTENARVLEAADLLRAGRLADIGPLLTASHTSMRDDFEITVAEVDVLVEVALDHGALGARMTGGGFGGCVIALVAADAVERCGVAAIVEFERRGFRAPHWFTEHAGAGAHAAG